MVERTQAEGLANSVDSKIRLESERVDDWDIALDRMERGTSFSAFIENTSSSSSNQGIDGIDTI